MDRDRAYIALGVTLLLVASAFFGALLVTGEHEDYYEVQVEILGPEVGATVSGVIMVKAAFHGNSEAELVSLKVDGATVARSNGEPMEWQLDTSNFLDGEHELQVVVLTKKGRVGAAFENITINNGGTSVSIRSPVNGATVTGQMELKVDAVSPRGIRYVTVSIDGNEVERATKAPFTWTIDTVPLVNGEHRINVTTSDELGVTAHAEAMVLVDNPFTIVDVRGKTVSFPKIPTRIISMGNSFTEILYAIHADGHVVGVDSNSKYPAQVSEKINVGSSSKLNLETILAAEPDCIILWSFSTSAITALESNGQKVVCFNPGSVSGVVAVINSISNITGHQSDARTLVDGMNARLHAVEQRIAGIPESKRPRVYFELRSTKSVGPGTITNELITKAGGKNIYSTASISYPLYNSEYIINANPDVIVIEDQSTKTNAQIESTAGWGSITAVLEHHILRLNGELASSTPRLVDAVEQMADYFFTS